MEEISRKNEKFLVNKNQNKFQNREQDRGESPIRKSSNNQSVISSTLNNTTNRSTNSKTSNAPTPATNKTNNTRQYSRNMSVMPITNNTINIDINNINNPNYTSTNGITSLPRKMERSNSYIKLFCGQNGNSALSHNHHSLVNKI